MPEQNWTSQNSAELKSLVDKLTGELDLYRANKLSLNLSRGKPASEQLDLSDAMDLSIAGNFKAADGTDTRNYGGMRGLPEARALGEEIMGLPAEHIIAAGNSSLSLMYFCVQTALYQGLFDQSGWQTQGKVRMLAPCPGYDRHFALAEEMGIELVVVDMQEDGPDMAAVEAAVRADASVKGIWCVPRFSNPTGCVYSSETVNRIATLPTLAAADDFVVMWDNAYAVHDIYADAPELASLHKAALKAGTDNHMVQFASTSKVTFAGAGVSFVSSGAATLEKIERALGFMTIGADKINQLRHARFLGGRVRAHMQQHADILRPKFEQVQSSLHQELGGLGIATWTEPKGGYFVSLDVQPGLAQDVIAMAATAGLTLTPAGATFPSGMDTQNSNIRIAPTFASLEELAPAMGILTLCVKLCTALKAYQAAQ